VEGKVCGGLQIHVTDGGAFRPYRTSLSILRETLRLWSAGFVWKKPPYEYERRRLPFDILSGDIRVRQALQEGRSPSSILRMGLSRLDRFRREAENHLIYR
jgi:uncharacterized protein YbbC (DUF1343 family)